MSDIEHDTAAHQFKETVDGHEAVLDYVLDRGVMVITHTGVPSEIGGRGIAARLTRAALESARTHAWTVDPQCSYAAAYLRRHPNEAPSFGGASKADRKHGEELLDEALDESFPASDPPAAGGSN